MVLTSDLVFIGGHRPLTRIITLQIEAIPDAGLISQLIIGMTLLTNTIHQMAVIQRYPDIASI